jgi:hypothetical protein
LIKSTFADIQKIESLMRVCTNSTENIQKNKKTAKPEEVKQYLHNFLAFIDCTEQQIPRPTDKHTERYTIQAKRKDIL